MKINFLICKVKIFSINGKINVLAKEKKRLQHSFKNMCIAAVNAKSSADTTCPAVDLAVLAWLLKYSSSPHT